MKKGEARKQQLLELLADHVLAHGLQGASLRPLAAAVGTSDRMLLHYFADKDELMTATLTLVSRRLVALLESARAEQMPFERLIAHVAVMIKDPLVRPYLRLWLELLPFAAGGNAPFGAVAGSIFTTFLEWIAAALAVEREEDRAPLAALALAIIEGFVLFDALGDDSKLSAALAGLALLPAARRGAA